MKFAPALATDDISSLPGNITQSHNALDFFIYGNAGGLHSSIPT